MIEGTGGKLFTVGAGDVDVASPDRAPAEM
jgi:hypothetical protein